MTDLQTASGRERILAAAAEVAAERGYEGTTISRICSRAGLPASSLYWFYKDKDDLLAAVVQHGYEEWVSEQPAWGPLEEGSWTQALRERLTVSLRSLASSPNFLRVGHMLMLERRDTSPAGRDLFLQVRRDARDLSTRWFTDVLDPELVAADPDLPQRLSQLVMAFSDGLFLSHQLDSRPWEPQVFADLLVDVLRATVELAQRDAEAS